MSNGLPKFCLRVTFDILLDDQGEVPALSAALQDIGAHIASETNLPVLVVGDILTNRDHAPQPASEPAPSKEASPLN